MLYVPFYLQQFYSWFYHEWNGNGFKRMEVRNEKSEDKRQCQVEIRLCLWKSEMRSQKTKDSAKLRLGSV